MGLSFGNLAGFWALLGIPAIIAIHFLQRRARQQVVSTLFLLEQLHRESEGGHRIERLRSSIPLWLQLLAVLLLTWLMVEPRWLERNSVQQVVVVLDGSASMQVSSERAQRRLAPALEEIAATAARTEFYLLDSRRDAGHLYHGDSVSGLMESVRTAWLPAGGSHDPAPALRLGRSLAGREGTVLYVTDHEAASLPLGARLFAVGEPEANAGISGLTVEEAGGRTVWRAMLRNYGTTPVTREWWVESGGAASARQSVTLAPQAAQAIQGAFPEGQPLVTLRLTPDTFTLDDTAPVHRPMERKAIAVLPDGELSLPPAEQHMATLFGSFPALTLTADRAGADLTIAYYNPLDPVLPTGPACLFVRDPRPTAPALGGTLIIEPHPLTESLNWHSLLAQESLSIPAQPGDSVLIWQGERPLLFLRGPAEAQQLCFNFDITQSNARRLPAFVITLHRFLDSLRGRLVREAWVNLECGQRLDTAVDTAPGAPAVTLTTRHADTGREETRTIPSAQVPVLTAPDFPASLELKQGDRTLLRAATHFADVREADFTAATSRTALDGLQAVLVTRHSREDPGWRLWLLLLLATLAAIWWFLSAPQRRARLTAPAA